MCIQTEYKGKKSLIVDFREMFPIVCVCTTESASVLWPVHVCKRVCVCAESKRIEHRSQRKRIGMIKTGVKNGIYFTYYEFFRRGLRLLFNCGWKNVGDCGADRFVQNGINFKNDDALVSLLLLLILVLRARCCL